MAPITRIRIACLTVASTLALAAGSEAQDAALPAGVTPAMVAEGGKLFRGAGLCLSCHGATGTGGIGPNLTDSTWIHVTGAYEELVQQITNGTTAKQSKSGVIMPPKGGGNLSEAQIRAVAAYVWTLSHPAAQ